MVDFKIVLSGCRKDYLRNSFIESYKIMYSPVNKRAEGYLKAPIQKKCKVLKQIIEKPPLQLKSL